MKIDNQMESPKKNVTNGDILVFENFEDTLMLCNGGAGFMLIDLENGLQWLSTQMSLSCLPDNATSAWGNYEIARNAVLTLQ